MNTVKIRMLWVGVSFSVVLLVSASNARADITYIINDYPVNEADQSGLGTDTLSGTIITDGTPGAWTGDPMAHIVGGTLKLVSPAGTYTGTSFLADGSSGAETLYATSTQLLSRPGDLIEFFAAPTPYAYTIAITYANGPYGGQPYYDGTVAAGGPELAGFDQAAPPGLTGSIGENNPWVIATAVPEPGTLTLLISALLGLGASYLRRRGAKA